MNIETHGSSFLAGDWVEGFGGAFTSTCPATGETVWRGQSASADQVSDAVQAARAAFAHWSRRPLLERREILDRYAEALLARREQMALAISRDMGKLLTESRAEVSSMAAKVAISSEAQAERAGERCRLTDFGRQVLTHRPHGVMGVLGPFNFPGHLPNGHIVPALLAGNTCVFKPSELAPSVAPIIMEAFTAAGLPAGCVNLVQGDRTTGAALIASDLDGLLFTGSEKTGRFLHAHFAGRPDVILALELGGNNPLIVWDPADVDHAADLAIQSAFITTGQRCSCARRLILPKGRFGDRVFEAIADRVRTLHSGAWHDENAFMGPLVTAEAARHAVAFQESLIASGGQSVIPLEQLDKALGFVKAGLIEMKGVLPVDEECFAPLLQVYRVGTIDEAVTLANATRFGLSASLVCEDENIWREIAPCIRAGILNLNCATTGASSALPFGGPGLSGNLRPGGYYAADYCAWPQASQIACEYSATP